MPARRASRSARPWRRRRSLPSWHKQNIISIGIGINSGPVVFGSVGAKDRMDFTSIGDTVNLAARLEGTNKEYGTKTLITESVYDKVKDSFLCREIDLVTVKGKTQPVRIYELLQETKSAAEKLERMKKLFEASLALYRKQKWDAAEKGFAALVKDYKDETSEIFLERVAAVQEEPAAQGLGRRVPPDVEVGLGARHGARAGCARSRHGSISATDSTILFGW